MPDNVHEYQQGDITWADYPLSDKPDKSKVRPVLIISKAKSNTLDNDFLIVPITSRIRGQVFEVILIEDKLTAGLPALSAVRCNKLPAIRNTRIISRIASVSPVALKEIVETVCQTFQSVTVKSN